MTKANPSSTRIIQDHFEEGSDFTKDDTTLSQLEQGAMRITTPLPFQHLANKTRLLVGLAILLVGFAVSAAAFILVCSSSAQHDTRIQFDVTASNLVHDIESAWNEYEMAGLLLHNTCHRSRNITRQDFRTVYEYLSHRSGLEIQFAGFVNNISHTERESFETESSEFYNAQSSFQHSFSYQGIVEFAPLNSSSSNDEFNHLSVQRRSLRPFYFPAKFAEPIETNAVITHLDLYSSPKFRSAIDVALKTWKPALSEPVQLNHEDDPDAHSVLLMHPGIPSTTDDPEIRPRDFSVIAIPISSFLARATRKSESENLAIHVYDSTVDPDPHFLGGIHMHGNQERGGTRKLNSVKETDKATSSGSNLVHQEKIPIASREWTVIIYLIPGETSGHNPMWSCLGGSMILLASCCLAFWLRTNVFQNVSVDTKQEAKAESTILSSLFPSHVRERVIQDVEEQVNAEKDWKDYNVARKARAASEQVENQLYQCVSYDEMMRERLSRGKPIADFIPDVTIVFIDLCNYTSYCSGKNPSEVFALLERIYFEFDNVARKHGCYKLETVGDSYVAVAGLPGEDGTRRKDHAVVMAKFATDCIKVLKEVARSLKATMGPDAGNLECRCGIHTGSVTAGVLRNDGRRFQLFGETINTASRMESTGKRGRIQVSFETAALLNAGNRENWVVPRKDKVFAKGIGELQTFWLDTRKSNKAKSNKTVFSNRVRSSSSSSMSSCGSSSTGSAGSKESVTDDTAVNAGLSPNENFILSTGLMESGICDKNVCDDDETEQIIRMNVDRLPGGVLQKVLAQKSAACGRRRLSGTKRNSGTRRFHNPNESAHRIETWHFPKKGLTPRKYR